MSAFRKYIFENHGFINVIFTMTVNPSSVSEYFTANVVLVRLTISRGNNVTIFRPIAITDRKLTIRTGIVTIF
jgi:hypothetical protein